MLTSESYRFGAFKLLPSRRELQYRGDSVPIGSRAFDLLTALVRREGRLATKNELIAEVWPDTTIDENNLPAQISAVRKALANDPALARSLQTVPGRGYQFSASIQIETGETGLSEVAGHGAGELSIVVMPFVLLSHDVDHGYIARAMTETVATDLSRIPRLLVISPSTALALKGEEDVRRISRELGVEFVLRGNLQSDGRRVRINAQLIEGRKGIQIWSEIFDSDSGDPFALQDQITGSIANAIGRELFIAVARDRKARNVDPESWDHVMRGIAEDTRPQSLDSLQKQETCFERAVTLDPNNCDAHARLARAIVLQATQLHGSPLVKEQALARGSKAAERAIVLNPANPHAQLAMTYVHVLRGEFEQAAIASEKAISLDRNLARAHNMLANALVHLGKASDAVLASEKALRLDPRGPNLPEFTTILGFCRLQLGEVDAALACFTRARAANPKLARAQAGAAFAFAVGGDIENARYAAKRLLMLVPDYRLSETIDGGLPTSPLPYRRFYDDVLLPAALVAGVPV